ALRYISRKADGSMRESISLLDQCIAFHYGEELTYEKVLNVLGAASYDRCGKLLQAVLDGRTADCIGLIDEIVMQGRELGQLVSDFIWYLRNIMLLKASDLDADTLEVSEEELYELAGMSRRISEETLMRYIRVFSELSGRIRQVADKRVLLEMTFIKLIRPETEYNLDSVLNRLEILEQKLEQGYYAVPGTAGPANNRTDESSAWYQDEKNHTENAGNRQDSSSAIRVPESQMERFQLLRKNWSKIITSLNYKAARAALQKAEPEPDPQGTGFQIVFDDDKYYTIGARTPYLTGIKEAVKKITGMECEFRFVLNESGVRNQYITEEQLQSVFQGVEIEEE
ncbi:MAG: DNA polymerase III subunit gamma/tau, partial [Lachnospiraceae bacterium]